MENPKKRIVVTGMGIVSAFGTDVDHFFYSLLQGKSGIGPITAFDCSEYPTRFGGEVKDFDVGDYMQKKQARRVDTFLRYAMVAGKKALEDAGYNLEDLSSIDPKRAGVVVSSGMGGMGVFSEGVETLLTKGFKRLTPFFVPYIITNMASGMLAIDLGFQGPNYSISTACATANHSILAAVDEMRLGRADMMLCGGTEAPMCPIGLAGFIAAKALSTRNDQPQKASRPWDKDRDGFVMGEGAGVLLLETLEHAQKRGARIYAEVLGGYKNCDANHMTDPREDGAVIADCIEKAIEEAGIDKSQINYINAHATSTPLGDMAEIRAIYKAFGDHCKNITINSTKSMTGHCLGSAAAVESIVCIKSIIEGKVHPTINLDNPEEGLQDLDPVKGKAKSLTVTAALNNSFGFGGHNATVIFAPYKG